MQKHKNDFLSHSKQNSFMCVSLKPTHAQWILDLFNYLTSEKGREIISNGWKAAAITDAITKGSHGLESFDPFQAIDPLVEGGEV